MSKTKLKLFKIYLPAELYDRLHARSDDMAISANHLAIFLISSGLLSGSSSKPETVDQSL